MRDRKKAQALAHELVSKMTIEERASQLKFDAPPVERLGVPAYNWWNEALHGVARAGTATMFPQPIAMASMFDPEMIQKIGDVVATEARAKYNEASKHGDRDIYKGLTFWSPNINLFRDPRWGRGQETYSEDPYLTARLGVAYIKGLQGDGHSPSNNKIQMKPISPPETSKHHRFWRMARHDSLSRLIAKTKSKNKTPTSPRTMATIPEDRGMYFRKMPMVPNITMAPIIFSLAVFSALLISLSLPFTVLSV